jgi:hypothetical protein
MSKFLVGYWETVEVFDSWRILFCLTSEITANDPIDAERGNYVCHPLCDLSKIPKNLL